MSTTRPNDESDCCNVLYKRQQSSSRYGFASQPAVDRHNPPVEHGDWPIPMDANEWFFDNSVSGENAEYSVVLASVLARRKSYDLTASLVSWVSRIMSPLNRSHSSGRVMARLALCGIVGLMALPGCASSDSGMFSKFRLKDPDGTTSDESWTTQAGTEGRAGRAMEKEPDPLHLRNLLMSEKAREIERNCGVE